MTETNAAAAPDTEKAVVISESAISLITKAEIDTQIATAQAFPRSLTKFKRSLLSMATIDQATAEACTYVLPRGKDKNGNNKSITGPSVRFAEMVAAAYGNLRTGARVIHNNGRVIVAQGVVHDLENNIMHSEEVERAILQWEYANGQKTGRKIPMSEDMQVVTGRAACAIAYRNAVYKVIPAALVQDVYEKVQETARGTAETLPARRKSRLDYFRRMGIKDEQIFAALEIGGEDDIDLDKIVILQGMVNAHKTDGVELETLFPALNAGNGKAKKAEQDAENKLKGKKGAAGTPNAGKAATDAMAADMGGATPQGQ